MQQSPTCFPYDQSQVYQPAEDSWLLLRAASREIMPKDRVLEVGTGSGAVSSRLSPCRLLVGTDINPHATRAARHAGIPVVRTDLTAGLRQVFDLVLFNPPYLPTRDQDRVDDWLEYALDGGPDGRMIITRFLAMVSDILTPGGRVLLLISSVTGIPESYDMIRKAGWSCQVIAEENIEGGERLLVFRLSRESEYGKKDRVTACLRTGV